MLLLDLDIVIFRNAAHDLAKGAGVLELIVSPENGDIKIKKKHDVDCRVAVNVDWRSLLVKNNIFVSDVFINRIIELVGDIQ
jgi:hypothetical protein